MSVYLWLSHHAVTLQPWSRNTNTSNSTSSAQSLLQINNTIHFFRRGQKLLHFSKQTKYSCWIYEKLLRFTLVLIPSFSRKLCHHDFYCYVRQHREYKKDYLPTTRLERHVYDWIKIVERIEEKKKFFCLIFITFCLAGVVCLVLTPAAGWILNVVFSVGWVMKH